MGEKLFDPVERKFRLYKQFYRDEYHKEIRDMIIKDGHTIDDNLIVLTKPDEDIQASVVLSYMRLKIPKTQNLWLDISYVRLHDLVLANFKELPDIPGEAPMNMYEIRKGTEYLVIYECEDRSTVLDRGLVTEVLRDRLNYRLKTMLILSMKRIDSVMSDELASKFKIVDLTLAPVGLKVRGVKKPEPVQMGPVLEEDKKKIIDEAY